MTLAQKLLADRALSPEQTRALAGAISKVDATPRDVARVVADALVDAELRGGLGVADLVIDG